MSRFAAGARDIPPLGRRLPPRVRPVHLPGLRLPGVGARRLGVLRGPPRRDGAGGGGPAAIGPYQDQDEQEQGERVSDHDDQIIEALVGVGPSLRWRNRYATNGSPSWPTRAGATWPTSSEPARPPRTGRRPPMRATSS